MEIKVHILTDYESDDEELMKVSKEVKSELEAMEIGKIEFRRKEVTTVGGVKKGAAFDWTTVIITLLSTRAINDMLKPFYLMIQNKKVREVTIETEKGKYKFVGYSESAISEILKLL